MAKPMAKIFSQYLKHVEVDLPAGAQPQRFQHGQIARQPDREGGQHDMEPDGEGELHTGQQDRVCS